MADRRSLRLAAVLLMIGFLFSLVVGLFHPGREDSNNHPAVFAEYASDPSWTVVHLGQFVGIAIVIAGLLTLVSTYNSTGRQGWINQMAGISAVVSLALYGVLQAVDGVALKRTVDALAVAPPGEMAARFASAEAIRWLEEGARSYFDIMFGLTFILVAGVILSRVLVSRPVGYLMGITGIFYMIQGFVVGQEGFSRNHGLFQLPAYIFLLAAVIWLLISAFRMKGAVQAPA